MQLIHFSEDPSIEVFEPHVPATNPTQDRSVWAIDDEHQAAYWFPRDCPRVTVWCDGATRLNAFERQFGTTSSRVQAIQTDHFPAMNTVVLYRYELPADRFHPWAEADGQWISHEDVEPIRVEPLGDLVALHRIAEIELRVLDSLWPLQDAVAAGDWPFSIIRMSLAHPRRSRDLFAHTLREEVTTSLD